MNSQTLRTAILVVIVFGVGFMIGRMTAPGQFTSSAIPTVNSVHEQSEGSLQEDVYTSGNVPTEVNGTSVNTTNLTPDQRQLLESLGINVDEVVITPQMVACAEAKLGVSRIEEIQNGTTPSFWEGTQLVACYSSN